MPAMASDSTPLTCTSCGFVSSAGAERCVSCGTKLSRVVANPREPELFGGPAASLGTTPGLGSVAGPVVELDYAGFLIRFAAALVDFVVLTIAYVLLELMIGSADAEAFVESDELTAVDWAFYAVFFSYVVLFIALKGQTLGKMAVGIKVIREDGRLPGLGYAALRETFGKLISGVALLLGHFWIAFDPKKQAWHDKMAGTVVVVVRRNRYRGPVA